MIVKGRVCVTLDYAGTLSGGMWLETRSDKYSKSELCTRDSRYAAMS